MATELKVPRLGMDMEEASILRWMVEEGATVEKGEPVLEIDTDKVAFEIEANADGTIHNLRGSEGETVPVGMVLAHIAAPGENLVEPAQRTPREEAVRAPEGASPDSRETRNGRAVRASPAARRAAAERGLDIQGVVGSGPGGRIYLSDVVGAIGEAATRSPDEVPEPAPVSTAAPDPARRRPLSRARRVGAQRTAKSFAEVPHFYLTRELAVDRVLELHGRLRKRLDPPASLTELFALAVARVLVDHPRLNARYVEGGQMEENARVDLGIAVSTDEGLLVPVVRGADSLALRGMVAVVKDAVRRAREGGLGPEELSGGTFTISNLGMMGVDQFDAIINPPQAGILALGRVRTVPEWEGDAWVPRRVVSATLSVDHRVADGADGARFLGDLQAVLSDWELLL